MYKINDCIVYGTEGICEIVDIAEKQFGDKCDTYYVLKPLYTKGSTVMVPVSNDLLVSKMRYMLSSQEIKDLIDKIPTEDAFEWIEDDKKRKDEFKKIILSGDRLLLIKLIKTMFVQGEEKKKLGKRLHTIDERFLKDAEKMLYEEFAVGLNIKKEEVLPYIISKIEAINE